MELSGVVVSPSFAAMALYSLSCCTPCCLIPPFFFLFLYLLLFSRCQAFSQHAVLSTLFLDHLVTVLDKMSVPMGDSDRAENTSHNFESPNDANILKAAILALTALFRYEYALEALKSILLYLERDAEVTMHDRGGGKTGKKVVEQSYSSVFSALMLQLGSCHGLAGSNQHEQLRYMTSSL